MLHCVIINFMSAAVESSLSAPLLAQGKGTLGQHGERAVVQHCYFLYLRVGFSCLVPRCVGQSVLFVTAEVRCSALLMVYLLFFTFFYFLFLSPTFPKVFLGTGVAN